MDSNILVDLSYIHIHMYLYIHIDIMSIVGCKSI